MAIDVRVLCSFYRYGKNAYAINFHDNRFMARTFGAYGIVPSNLYLGVSTTSKFFFVVV